MFLDSDLLRTTTADMLCAMRPQLNNLIRALGRVREPLPADLATALAALPAVEDLPSPWETWTLIGLMRHRERQLWVGDVVTSRLQGNLLDLARLGAFGHPQGLPQSGLV